MDTNDEMASLVVKKQLNPFKVKKVMKEEAKHPLAWQRGHEVQFLYVGFVGQQILRIVKSQIEIKKSFQYYMYLHELLMFLVGHKKY